MSIQLLEDLLKKIILRQPKQNLYQAISNWQVESKVKYDKQFSHQFVQLFSKHLLLETNSKKNNIQDLYVLAELLLEKGLILQRKPLIQMFKLPFFTLFSLLYDLFGKYKLFSKFNENTFLSCFKIIFHDDYDEKMFWNLVLLSYKEMNLKSDQPYTFKAKVKLIIQTLQQAQILSDQEIDLQPESPIGSQLEEFLEHKFQTNRISDREKVKIDGVVDSFVSLLLQIDFTKIGITNLEYQYFGSQLNGFGTKSSDVDFTLLTNSFVDERQLLKFIHHELVYQIRDKSGSFKYENIYGDRVRVRIPLLAITHKKTNFDIDLCVNNILGAINTQLILQYSLLHPHIQKAGVLLKLWAKKCNLINQKTLSSYAVILMFIHFLQKEYSVPILQDSNKISKIEIKRCLQDNKNDIFTTDCYFLQDEDLIRERSIDAKKKLDETNLSSLILQFWRFYHQLLQQNNFRRIFIHNSKMDDERTIIDPIDLNHDPGEKMFKQNQLPKVKQIFEYYSSQYLNDYRVIDLF